MDYVYQINADQLSNIINKIENQSDQDDLIKELVELGLDPNDFI